jgi:hypothetical protein
MGKKKNAIRFAVGTSSGPRSAIWRVWTEPDNSIYIAERYTAGRLKASLHPRGSWRIAFGTPEEAQRLTGTDADRAFDKFGPSQELATGVRRVFTVLIPWLSVAQPRHGKTTKGAVHWLPPLGDSQVEEVIMFLTGPNIAISTEGAKVVGQLGLRNGSTVWVVNHRRVATSEEGDAWTRARAELSETEQARRGATPDADMRANLMGKHGDGSRVFVDLLLQPPREAAQ